MKGCPHISEFEDLGFLYDPDHYSWLQRHRLNWSVKRELKRGGPFVVRNEAVAEQLHRYYRVPKEDIIL